MADFKNELVIDEGICKNEILKKLESYDLWELWERLGMT